MKNIKDQDVKKYDEKRRVQEKRVLYDRLNED